MEGSKLGRRVKTLWRGGGALVKEQGEIFTSLLDLVISVVVTRGKRDTLTGLFWGWNNKRLITMLYMLG